MKELVVVKAGGSNFASVEDALERIGCRVFYAEKEGDIVNAEKVLLPGVGSVNAVDHQFFDVIKTLKQPVLGVCLGMQILFEKSQENYNITTLGVISGDVKRIPDDVIVPHMGWNKLIFTEENSIFLEEPASFVYFTHSYYAPCEKFTTSYCEYGTHKISAIVQKDNFYGFQFHPERSGKYGEFLLRQFIEKL